MEMGFVYQGVSFYELKSAAVVEGQAYLTAYYTRLLKSPWHPLESLQIKLSGLNLDIIWEKLLIEIGGIAIQNGSSLDEQLVIDENRQKLAKQIATLEKQARPESQSKYKFELMEKIKSLEKAGQKWLKFLSTQLSYGCILL